MRTKLPARVRKSKMIYLRVSMSELAAIEQATKKSGKFTTAEWLREIVTAAIDKCPT